MSKNNKVIPTKNYIFLTIIILVSIFLVYYFVLWYRAYEESKINMPIMDSYMQVINYNELSSYLLENESTLVYVSVVGDDSIRNFEKKFKNTIVKHSLNDVLYLNVSEELNNGVSLEYNIHRNKIPCILVFEGDELLDTYYIDVNNYNLKKIRKYLVAMGADDEY